LTHRGKQLTGTARTFDLAKGLFEAAWETYRLHCTEEDFQEHRRKRAATAWKYAMWDAGCRMPTQNTDGRSKCLCGAEITIANVDEHIYAAHLDLQNTASLRV
jgi:hypothetical protein